MTLTAKGEATRVRIIEGTAAYLRSIDFADITLDEVMASTHTSKGQLFHYFPDGKDQLLLAVMQLEAGRVLADQEPYISQLDSQAAWAQWREVLVARYRTQGTACPLNALVRQIGATPGAEQVTLALFARWQGYLADGIRSMQASGGIRAQLDADRSAAALVAAIQGGVVVMWVTGTTAHLEAAVDIILDNYFGEMSARLSGFGGLPGT
jgi:AcrR family transcriptional regulator